MFTPLIGLAIGITVLWCTALGYAGSFSDSPLPSVFKQKGNLFWTVGNIAIGLALILGIFGYFGYIDSPTLRLLRVTLGISGLVMLGSRLIQKPHLLWAFPKEIRYLYKDIKVQTRSWFLQIQRYWELLSVLVPQNLHARYRGSFLGVYWSLLNPLLMMGIYTAIFGAAFASYYNNSILNYILAAFTGLVVTNFYAASTAQALSSVVGNGGLLNKMRLPVGIFPVSMIAANLFQFSMGVLPLLAIVTLVITKNPLNILALLFPLLSLALVSMGVGFLVSALFVFFRDLGYFYELVCFVMWMSSPVFYPAEIIPQQVKPFIGLNPLVPIIENLREITLAGTLPEPSSLAGSLLSGVIILAFGWAFFQWLRPQFMDLL
jgi:lipopolysaccharide transport system permease protein